MAQLTNLDGAFRFLREPGAWLWMAALAGAAARAYLVIFTEGTLDVLVWEGHAREISERGLMTYYHGGTYQFNHPPLMGLLASKAWSLSQSSAIPFEVLLRAPFALLDAGTAWLLVRLLEHHPQRYLVAAAYWLSPLAILFSAYHGNTDSAVAFFLVATVALVARGRAAAAGALLGASLWIKLPGLLAVPALWFALPDWRARAKFTAAAAVVGFTGYAPALAAEAEVVIRAVFLYSGLRIQTTAGIPIWGIQILQPAVTDLSRDWGLAFHQFLLDYYRFNTVVCAAAIVLVAWCRRRAMGGIEIAGNIAACYAVLYGLTSFWAFQYLAWSLPFWLVAGWRFGLAASLVSTTYIYVLYAWLCSSPFLLGEWDFMGQPHWPQAILLLRDAAALFFFATAWYTILRAVASEARRWRRASSADTT
jgi:hypothetical protein